MSYRREHRGSRSSLFDGLEEGGLSASSSYSHETNDHDNDRAVDSLQDRVLLLKRNIGAGDYQKEFKRFLGSTCNFFNKIAWFHHGHVILFIDVPRYSPTDVTGDIHEEVESHNRLLDRMGNDMDSSRGVMSGTMDRFKMVFEKKSNRRMCTLVMCFVVSFLIILYLIRMLRYFTQG